MGFATCVYCGRYLASTGTDPQGPSKAGAERGTKLPVCLDCKRSKRDRPLTMWLRMLKKKDRMRWDRIVKHHSRRRGGQITMEVKRIERER